MGHLHVTGSESAKLCVATRWRTALLTSLQLYIPLGGSILPSRCTTTQSYGSFLLKHVWNRLPNPTIQTQPQMVSNFDLLQELLTFKMPKYVKEAYSLVKLTMNMTRNQYKAVQMVLEIWHDLSCNIQADTGFGIIFGIYNFRYCHSGSVLPPDVWRNFLKSAMHFIMDN